VTGTTTTAGQICTVRTLGASDSIVIADSASNTLTSSFTFGMTVRSSDNGIHFLLSKTSASSIDWYFQFQENRTRFWNAVVIQGANNVVGNWETRSESYDGATHVTTVNGTATSAARSVTVDTQADLYLGRRASGNNFLGEMGLFYLAKDSAISSGWRTQWANIINNTSFYTIGAIETQGGTPTGYTITADTGAFSLTGITQSLLADRTMTAETGSFTLTGNNIDLLAGRIISAVSGAFNLTGQDAALAAARVLSAESGSFGLTGNDQDVLANKLLTASTGSYSMTGEDVTLSYTPVGGSVNYDVIRAIIREELQNLVAQEVWGDTQNYPVGSKGHKLKQNNLFHKMKL
jgi:hypothetical protein